MVPSQLHTNTVPGWCNEDIIDVTADNSYPAGGYAFGNAQLQTMYGSAYSTLISVEMVNCWINTAANGTAYMAGWDKTNGKIHAFAQAVAGGGTAQVDVTAATNLTGFVCSVRIRFN